jgi:hypothetical protein
VPPGLPTAAPLQPLIPSREQQEEAGLPKPLLRYKDAEPLLGEDPRYERFPEEYRWGGAGICAVLCVLCMLCVHAVHAVHWVLYYFVLLWDTGTLFDLATKNCTFLACLADHVCVPGVTVQGAGVAAVCG